EARRLAIELREHRGAGVLGLVLGLAGAQRILEVVPEAEEAIVVHLEEPAQVVLAAAHQESGALGGVRVVWAGPGPFPLEHAERHQRIDEVRDGTGMEAETLPELLTGERSVTELVEKVELGGDQQDLRAHEAAADLGDPGRRERFRHGDLPGAPVMPRSAL